MGARHSRGGPGAKLNNASIKKPISNVSSSSSYFIVNIRGDKIKIVHAEPKVVNLIKVIFKNHCEIIKESWDHRLTFSFRLKHIPGYHWKIQLLADILLTLKILGWEPMTPLETDTQKTNKKTETNYQVTVCFRKKKKTYQDDLVSILSDVSNANGCLCLETYKSDYLGFHDVSNTMLHDLVTTIQQDWIPGIKGVSMGVSSVMSDYTNNMPPVIQYCKSSNMDDKYILLKENPWTSTDDSIETIYMSIVSCLIKDDYNLTMDVSMNKDTRMLFFIKDREQNSKEVRLPNLSGPENTMPVYRPMVVRSKSSFFRNYHGRTNSVRRKVRASLQRKSRVQLSDKELIAKKNLVGASKGLTYKVMDKEPAWWQQTSTDVSSDFSDDESIKSN